MVTVVAACRESPPTPNCRRAAATNTHTPGDSTGAPEPEPHNAADTAPHTPDTTAEGTATASVTARATAPDTAEPPALEGNSPTAPTDDTPADDTLAVDTLAAATSCVTAAAEAVLSVDVEGSSDDATCRDDTADFVESSVEFFAFLGCLDDFGASLVEEPCAPVEFDTVPVGDAASSVDVVEDVPPACDDSADCAAAPVPTDDDEEPALV